MRNPRNLTTFSTRAALFLVASLSACQDKGGAQTATISTEQYRGLEGKSVLLTLDAEAPSRPLCTELRKVYPAGLPSALKCRIAKKGEQGGGTTCRVLRRSQESHDCKKLQAALGPAVDDILKGCYSVISGSKKGRMIQGNRIQAPLAVHGRMALADDPMFPEQGASEYYVEEDGTFLEPDAPDIVFPEPKDWAKQVSNSEEGEIVAPPITEEALNRTQGIPAGTQPGTSEPAPTAWQPPSCIKPSYQENLYGSKEIAFLERQRLEKCQTEKSLPPPSAQVIQDCPVSMQRDSNQIPRCPWELASTTKTPPASNSEDDDTNSRSLFEKPVIYLYPPKDMKVKVSLSFPGELTFTHPVIRDGAWQVLAKPDGILRDLADGREYPYLFWEGDAPLPGFNDEEGFLVRGRDAREFLVGISDRIGLNARESADFVTYWAPRLSRHQYSHVHFLGKQYEDFAKLSIVPKPDSIYRLYIVIREADPSMAPRPQSLPRITRRGFTVVEWGGSELGSP